MAQLKSHAKTQIKAKWLDIDLNMGAPNIPMVDLDKYAHKLANIEEDRLIEGIQQSQLTTESWDHPFVNKRLFFLLNVDGNNWVLIVNLLESHDYKQRWATLTAAPNWNNLGDPRYIITGGIVDEFYELFMDAKQKGNSNNP